VAGLKTEIREKLIFNPPNEGFINLWNSCLKALEVEKNLAEPNKATAAVIDLDDKRSVTEQLIEAIRYPSRGGHRGRGRGGYRKYNNNNNRGQEKFDGDCNYCHKKGHMKKDCWALKGKPRKVAGVHEGDQVEGDQDGNHVDLAEFGSIIGTLDYLN